MSTSEVKALAVQLSSVIDTLEMRIDHAARQSLQATQTLDQQSRQSLEAANGLVRQALDQFRAGAKQALAEGVRDAIHDIDQTMHSGADRLDQAVSQLDLRMQHMGCMNVSYAWKTFVASALGSLAVIGVAIYIAWQTHADIKRSEWIRQINAAVDAGQLAPCPEDGLCVKVDNKWVRLHDK
jgi:hypothetical protein